MNYTEKDKNYIWHPYTSLNSPKMPIVIVKGHGVYLYSENGEKYLDAISSWWVNTHGHANTDIAKKMIEQLLELEHVIFAGFTHPAAIDFAERLLKHLPKNHRKLFYSDDGSTSVEVAIKIAIQYWKNQAIPKTKIIAFKNSYHGDTFGSMSVSSRSVFNQAFDSFLFDVEFIDVPLVGNEEKSFTQLNDLIKQNDVAAFIYEPLVLGAGGMIMYTPESLNKMILQCKKENVITIADEVMTGFYRTGKFFASDYMSEKPDLICLSKGITGGTMAMGVTSIADNIINAFENNDSFKTFYHGHSYTANPIACAAALASLDLYEQDDCKENVKRICVKHSEFLNLIKENSKVKEIRQCGTILAIELKTISDTSYLNTIRDTIYEFFLQRKIILRPLGNIIYILPPYCISNHDLDYIYSSIVDFLEII